MKESLKLAVELAKRGESGREYGTVLPGNLCGCLFPGQTDDGKPGEARELVRQVYLVVFRTISTLQDTTKMERWLYTVLYKLGERECRKKGSFWKMRRRLHPGKDRRHRRRRQSVSRLSGF